jgi:glycosyltransferase involved in cell wall biosynthesis
MNTNIKLFIFYDYFSPAYKAGGPIQSINAMVKALNKNFDFSIFCSDHDLDGGELEVEKDEWINCNSFHVFYASQQYLKIKNILTLIKDKRPAILFINGIYSWYFNLVPLLFSKEARKIVSVRGMLHPGALSQKPFKKKIYLLLWKLFRIHHRCEFHATTAKEKEFIESVFGKDVKTWVAGNFSNLLDYHTPLGKQKGTLILISVALISPMKNHLLVLQGLKNCSENITYLIYGPVKDNSYWQECLSLIEKMPANITIVYKGEIVPDKIPAALQEAHVFILPSKSENFGHSLYEAMTAGKPVITSHFTPWNNLKENNAGINVSIDNPNEIGSAVDFFANADGETIETWSKGARAFALKSVDIDNIKKQYLEMFSGDSNTHS